MLCYTVILIDVRMTNYDVIGNPQIKEDFYLNGDDIIIPCHSEAQRRIQKNVL